MFCLMSGRKILDYKLVLRKLKKMVPEMKVKRVVLDFERAAWKAFG